MSILSQQKQSVNTDFPNIRPSLDLRFALAKKLDPRITFSRGSTGTYFGSDGLMRTASVNEPRFDHDPVTGQSLGLLIEESRQNLFTNSNDFTIWTKQTNGGGVVGITTNILTSPDGTTNASRYFVQTGGGTFYSIYRSFTAAANTYYTYSVFAKAGEFNTIGLIIFDGSNNTGITYNIGNGTIVGSYSAVNMTVGNLSIINYGNGWYRCIFPFSHSLGGSFTPKIDLGGTLLNYGVYLYGAQLEQGEFPTSYIPTTASTVTRSKDTVRMTGTNFSSWYNQSEGTFFTNVKSSTNFISGTNACPFGIFTAANQIVLANYHNLSSTWLFRNSVASNNAFFNVTMSATQNRKSIATYRTGPPDYYTAAFGGSNLEDFTSLGQSNPRTGTLRTDQSYFELNPSRSGLVPLNGTISRLTYYPIQITNQQLINLTS